MKKENLFKYAFSLLVAFVASILGGGAMMAITTPEPQAGEANTGLPGVEGNAPKVGTHISTEGVDGVTTDITRANAPEMIVDPLDAELIKMQQTGIPIEQITRQMTPVAVNGMRYQFYSVDTRENKAKVATTGGFTANAANTIGQLKIADDKAAIFDKTDIIMLPSVAGFNAFKPGAAATLNTPLNLYVRKVTGDTLEVQAVNGADIDGSNMKLIPTAAITAALAAGDVWVIRLGHAASEGDVLTSNYAALPTKQMNYMQIFKAQSLESTINAMSDHEVAWDKTASDVLMIGNLRQDMETTWIFGKRGYIYNNDTQRFVYTTSGLIEQIMAQGSVLTYDDATPSEDEWIDITKSIFIGNNGSTRRLVFAGPDFIAAHAKANTAARHIGAMETEIVYGIEWNKVKTNFGTLDIIMHPLFAQLPQWSARAIVIDPQHLSKRVFKSMWRQVLDLKSSGQFDGEGAVLSEISSLCLKYPKCHAIIIPESQA